MGLLVDGKWQDQWYQTKKGAFVRESAQFRHWVTADGAAGITGDAGFKAEAGRYHLFVAMACPWANRTMVFRALKGLEKLVDVTIVDTVMLEHGWTFSELAKNNPLGDLSYCHQVYTAADPNYTGRVTVPILWDKKNHTIVSNESADIIRMFNTAFNDITDNTDDYYPQSLREEIDELNEMVYHSINNGVYRCGFATTQEAYELAYDELFVALDKVEDILASQRYLIGDQLTEADWRLFTTLIRFDAVYYGHFKTNKKRIEDYPNISNYVRELYQVEGIAATVDFAAIKKHYYYSHTTVNPTQIIPKGPDLNYLRPHNRAQLK